MKKSNFIVVSAAFSVAIVAYLLWLANERQVAIDNCDVQMSDDEIKLISAQELMKVPSLAYRANASSVDDLIERARWVIIKQKPKKRLEAESEYDMIKYEAVMEINGRRFNVSFGSCKNIINVG
ncbi:hypothetical protein M728_004056 (plasmid) [Ensifer sp. WSM1721]